MFLIKQRKDYKIYAAFVVKFDLHFFEIKTSLSTLCEPILMNFCFWYDSSFLTYTIGTRQREHSMMKCQFQQPPWHCRPIGGHRLWGTTGHKKIPSFKAF